MSAPDTNIPKQTKRHRPALTAIAGSLVLAGTLFAGYLLIMSGQADDPVGAQAQVDSRTGAVVSEN